MVSILSQLFVTERHRVRASDVGHSIPLITEMTVPADATPMLASNMRGEFLESPRSREGYGRCGFSLCPLAEEMLLVRSLYDALFARRVRWRNVVLTVEDAVAKMDGSAVTVACGSRIPVPEGLQRVDVDIADGSALVFAAPADCGRYTRVGDYAGLLCFRAASAVCIVSSVTPMV